MRKMLQEERTTLKHVRHPLFHMSSTRLAPRRTQLHAQHHGTFHCAPPLRGDAKWLPPPCPRMPHHMTCTLQPPAAPAGAESRLRARLEVQNSQNTKPATCCHLSVPHCGLEHCMTAAPAEKQCAQRWLARAVAITRAVPDCCGVRKSGSTTTTCFCARCPWATHARMPTG